MADVKIKDLPLASAVGSSVVPVMNAAGTATNSVALSSIAALGGGPPAAHASSHATGGSDPISASSIGAAASSHTHGSLTSDGKIGSVGGLPVVTGTAGAITAGAFGTAAGTFCQGNDSRLSNSRTPSLHASSHAAGGVDALAPADIGAASATHAHGNITSAGAVGTTSGLPLITTTSGVIVAGSFGTASGTFCQGNDSRLSNSRTPVAHASSHATGGSDALSPEGIGAAAATHAHGNITSAGAVGSTSGLPLITTTSGVVIAGEFGTASGTFCQGNDSRLSNARTPTAHADSHAVGGADALTLAIGQVFGLQAAIDLRVRSDSGAVSGSVAISNIVKVTQSQYDAIASPSSTTLYIIVG